MTTPTPEAPQGLPPVPAEERPQSFGDVELGGYDDHDGVADETEAAPTNALEALRAELARELKREPLVLDLRRRPGWGVRYDLDKIDGELVEKLRRSATNKSRSGPLAGQVDGLLFTRLVVASACDALLREGQVVTDPEAGGDPLKIASRTLLGMVGASKAAEAVGLLFADDGQVSAHANAVLDAAGFNEDGAERTDPTDALEL